MHLALLIHDLGKGHVEDHSEVGLRIAEQMARRLRLPEREAETLKFLVHKHLLMSHLAFRRDTSDDQLIVRFAVEVGSPEVLRMLYLLTAADFAAVGPGVLNQWKEEVLSDLYHRTMRHLSGDSPSASAEERRAELRTLLREEADAEWFDEQVAALPSSLVFSMPPQRLADELRQLQMLSDGEVRIGTRYLSDTGTVEFVVATHEEITPGVFHKLTGGLTSQGLEILSADINTLADRLVLDLFVVRDPDYAGPPPPDRIEQINRRLNESLTAESATGLSPRLEQRQAAASRCAQRAADPRAHRQQLFRPVHDHRHFRLRPDRPAVHDRPHDLRTGLIRLAGEDRHVPRSGRGRVLRDRSWKATKSTTNRASSKSAASSCRRLSRSNARRRRRRLPDSANAETLTRSVSEETPVTLPR